MHLYVDYVTLVTLVGKESYCIRYIEISNRKRLLIIAIVLRVFLHINFLWLSEINSFLILKYHCCV